jgi:hypothetical protein
MKLSVVRDKMTCVGLEIHTGAAESIAQALRNNFEKWGKLAQRIGFKLQ